MLAIGAGGLDVACAMAGEPFYMSTPKVIGVKLTGKLDKWVSSKDIILHILREKGVKGGVGAIFEYFGPGVKTLSVPERSTMTNMGAELGATTSIFPSDENTLDYLKKQGRETDHMLISADDGAEYDELIEIANRTTGAEEARPAIVTTGATIMAMQRLVRQVPIASHLTAYAVRLLEATHPRHASASDLVRRYVRYGASPRGLQAMIIGAKTIALIENRHSIDHQDLQTTILPALRHRL